MAGIARARQAESRSTSPESSSDKENRQNSSRSCKRAPTQTMASSGANAKRQRLAQRASNIQGSQSQLSQSQRLDNDKKYYDPDQDEKERRRIRRELRELHRELNGNSALSNTYMTTSMK